MDYQLNVYKISGKQGRRMLEMGEGGAEEGAEGSPVIEGLESFDVYLGEEVGDGQVEVRFVSWAAWRVVDGEVIRKNLEDTFENVEVNGVKLDGGMSVREYTVRVWPGRSRYFQMREPDKDGCMRDAYVLEVRRQDVGGR